MWAYETAESMSVFWRDKKQRLKNKKTAVVQRRFFLRWRKARVYTYVRCIWGRLLRVPPFSIWGKPHGSSYIRRLGEMAYGVVRLFHLSYPNLLWDWYIYLHEWLIFMGFHVGKYTSPVEHMGYIDSRMVLGEKNKRHQASSQNLHSQFMMIMKLREM